MNFTKDYTTSDHWERLDKIIKTLIFIGEVHDDTDFYKQVKLDIASASLVRNKKRTLPKKARLRMVYEFDVSEDFLLHGIRPILLDGDPDRIDDVAAADLAFLKSKVEHQEGIIKELREVLKEAIKFGKIDLKNKGLLDDSHD